MAWNRVLQVRVGEVGSPVAMEISGLDVAFRINRTLTGVDDGAEITVYNASDDTRAKILRKRQSVTVTAGYKDDIAGVIFVGNITDVTHTQQGADIVTVIQAASQVSLWTDFKAFITLSYAPRTPLTTVLQELETTLGIVVHGLDNAFGLILPNGFSFVGSPYDAVQRIQQELNSRGRGVFWDLREMVIYKKGVPSKYEAVYLDYASGLTSVKEVQENDKIEYNEEGVPFPERKRVGFVSLLNWRIRPNGLVIIDTTKDGQSTQPRLKGAYLVEKVEFAGDNFGGAFIVSGEATE